MSELATAKSPILSVRQQVSEDEWNARVDLAACLRLIAKYGMSDLTYNHVTSRVPGHHDELLINPYGMLYNEMRASDMFKVDHQGKVILKPDIPYDQNPAGFVVHGAVHSARLDVGCVIHTHTRAGMAVSAMKCGLLPLTQTAMRFYGRVSYHDFEGPAINLEERARLIANLGTNDALVLRNHGLLTCGRSVAEAFNNMYWLEMACKAQVDAMASGTELIIPHEDVAQLTAKLYTPGVRRTYGELEWPAMLRLIEKEDNSYRD